MIKNTKVTPGPFKEIIEGPSQHGGVFTVIYYFNSRYRPVSKDRATRSIIHEYDEKERSIFRDYQTLSKGIPLIDPAHKNKKEDAKIKEINVDNKK